NASDARYTLSANDEPFWKVIAQLGEQHPMTPVGGTIGLALTELQYRHTQTSMGLAVRSNEAKWADGKVTLELNAVLDPRIVVFDYRPLEISTVRDDLGHELKIEPDPPRVRQPGIRPAPERPYTLND